MKDNKLIAEFMGDTFYPEPQHWYDSHGSFIGDTLKYHTSWDWLMPVVRKIEDGGLDPHETIATALESRVIEDVYNEVVDTIKRYNDEQQ
jgi:hypothetical protein